MIKIEFNMKFRRMSDMKTYAIPSTMICVNDIKMTFRNVMSIAIHINATTNALFA